MTERESGDELWDEFVREFNKNNAIREPSAAERAAAVQAPAGQPAAGQARRGRRLLKPLAVLGGLAVAAGAMAYLVWSAHPLKQTAAPAPAVTAASGSGAPSPSSPAALATAAIPLTVFPDQVQGYTRVARNANPKCTGTDTVRPTLAALIEQSHGCLGADLAYYKDADGNEYNLVLFTMKDPVDAVHLTMVLGADPGDYQVAVQLPPAGSGLRELPADSGLVQQFAGTGNAVIVGLAQWSDGRSSDFQQLEDRLTPLVKAVAERVHN
ncbi:hypothetical protein [Kitasatospora sp. HPMI-4]|uniref:hypothetical protein n=1 Tax=Kitasatospora sp. HPMI-4 TaxID=3448443 RepID=UPI003F1AE552